MMVLHIEGTQILEQFLFLLKKMLNVFSDDTGLEIEALNNEPGVRSARYSGEEKNSLKNIKLVLKKLKGISNRNARFKTVISLIIDDKNYCFEGVVNGTIIDKPIGDMGFGFDSIFVANNMNKTFAEISVDEKNMIRSKIGRSWMAIRDMDIAAEIIGVSPLKTKLSAFAISSFYIGIAGSLYFAVYLGALEVTESFDIMAISFPVLFMIIIGGLGSMLGSFLGAAFIVLLPIFLKNVMVDLIGLSAVTAKHFEITTWGLLMVVFLIVEPHGLARLWSIAKEKLRKWPFPY